MHPNLLKQLLSDMPVVERSRNDCGLHNCGFAQSLVILRFYKGTVLEENHYYPFGLTLSTATTNPAEKNSYKLTTKELEDKHGLNWYDFGARMQDMQIGRWGGIDPHAEQYRSYSPYSYTNNNPVHFIDPDGKDAHISGELSDEAVRQLNSSVHTVKIEFNSFTGLTISPGSITRDDNGKLSYSGVPATNNDKLVTDVIDDHSIDVNLTANNTYIT